MSFAPAVTATPTATVAGIPVAVAGTSGAYLAVDDLAITWGRASLFEHPTPATAELTVLDRDVLAGFPLTKNLIGQSVILGVHLSDGSSLTTFRGRITDQTIAPAGDRTQITGGFTSTGGYRVSIAASSKEVDLANYTVLTDSSWTPETILARRSRIAAQLPSGFLTGGILPPDVAGMGLSRSAVEPANNTVAQPDLNTVTDVHALLRQLWDSTYPAPMVYDPAADAVVAVRPPVFAAHASGAVPTGRLLASSARGGAYVAVPEQVAQDASTDSVTGFHLDAQSVTNSELSLSIDAHLSRVEVQYLTQTSASGAPLAYQQSTSTAGVTLDEDTRGRRTLTVSTVLTSATAAATLAGYWATLAAAAPAHRRLGPLTYATANPHNGGGFENTLAASTLLAGCEQPTPAFLGGTWLSAIGARPMVVILGATTTYADGDWTVTFTPHPVQVAAGTENPLPIRYADKTNTVTLAQVDPSVTLGDLAWVDIGAGYTATTQLPLGTG